MKIPPPCPNCGEPLYEVTYPTGSWMNRDQFEATKSGDWYCLICKSDKAKSGFAYFWDNELPKAIQYEI